jgi:osmotically-inducible protein OsmY
MTNEALQKSVQDALKWEPFLNAAAIGVSVENGIVTLSGTVDNYAKKAEAIQAAKSIIGVKAVVEKIEVHLNYAWIRDDADIASEVLNALKWNWQIQNDAIKVAVEDGWVTLDGYVKWNYQKLSIANAVKNQIGVKGLTNNITIQPISTDEIEKKSIENALGRNSSIDERNITVTVSGHRVILTGNVHSLNEKLEAEKTAWNACGISDMDNELIVGQEELFV